jgi:hypothetical protein
VSIQLTGALTSWKKENQHNLTLHHGELLAKFQIVLIRPKKGALLVIVPKTIVLNFVALDNYN